MRQVTRTSPKSEIGQDCAAWNTSGEREVPVTRPTQAIAAPFAIRILSTGRPSQPARLVATKHPSKGAAGTCILVKRKDVTRQYIAISEKANSLEASIIFLNLTQPDAFLILISNGDASRIFSVAGERDQGEISFLTGCSMTAGRQKRRLS